MKKACLFLLLLSVICAPALADKGAKSEETTVMSFNIRYKNDHDGENTWDKRRYIVRMAIRNHAPDIFGLQECLWDEGVELNEAFFGYRLTGVGRDDGVRQGEMCLIFTRKDRYHVLDQGHFWLSETPEEPGSLGWDAACPRITTWIKVRDRWCNPDTFFVFNTHLDHVGTEARDKGTALLQTRMAEISAGKPVLLLGDFNTSGVPGEGPYDRLAVNGWEAGLPLRDTWFYASKEERQMGDGTFHGFTGQATRGRIDWILASKDFPVLAAGISRHQKNGRYPSDHFPVWATFLLERHPPLPGDLLDAYSGATPSY